MNAIRELMPCQVSDPGRGSFMVHPLPIKKANGSFKTKRCSDGETRRVMRAGHHIKHDKRGESKGIPHPEAIDYVVLT